MRRRLAEPPTGPRARDPEIRDDGHVPGALDEIPKPVVVALLSTPWGRHGHHHRPFAHAAQHLEDIAASADVRRSRGDDNSRPKVQNVRGDRSAVSITAMSGAQRKRPAHRPCPSTLVGVPHVAYPHHAAFASGGGASDAMSTDRYRLPCR